MHGERRKTLLVGLNKNSQGSLEKGQQQQEVYKSSKKLILSNIILLSSFY